MKDISAFDLYEYLPSKIQELLFSHFMDNLMATAFSLANVAEENQTLMHRDTVSVLIGKYDLKQYSDILKIKYNLTDNLINSIVELLNEKLFKQIASDLIKSRSIYKQFSEGQVDVDQKMLEPVAKQSINSPEKLVSYIQELASSLKKEEEPKKTNIEISVKPPVKETVLANEAKEEVKVEPTIIKNEPIVEEPIKEVIPEVKPVEEIPAFIPKESTVFKMMKQKESQDNGKLNEYFKALKDSLDFENTAKTENIFQPPFKATKGRSMLVESGMEDNAMDALNDAKENQVPQKAPVRYNSFEFMKKPNTPSETKTTDDKFIDLGDF